LLIAPPVCWSAWAEGRIGVVRDGLGDGPENQADAHPSLEEHREPREAAELGSVVRLAEPDLAVAGKGQPDGEAQKEARHEHVQPAEIVRDPTHHRRKRAAKGVGEEHAGQDKYRRDGDRDVEHRPELLYLLSLGPRCLSLLL
jgi:hypothetical protein